MKTNLGEKFAAHIDALEFDEAKELISDECIYRCENETHKGKEGVIAIYRHHHEEATKLFDEIAYDSEVELIDGDTCKIRFTDQIKWKGLEYETVSQQVLKFENGKIVSIVHSITPDEMQGMRRFFQTARARG